MKVTLTSEGELDNMSRPEHKPTVFISYSHKDEDWKDRLCVHLRGLEQQGHIVLWDDRKIDTGDKWYPAIEKAIERAAVAVCMISQNYLASDFINKDEVPDLLRRCQEAGMLLLPIIVLPCPWKTVDWLRSIRMFPKDAKPVASIRGKIKQEQALADFAEQVYNRIKDPAFTIPKPSVAWAQLPDNCISIERLPKTGAEVFGRKEELALLDEAWESDTTRIVSFVAWGGVGKSALVNKWVEQMAEDNYRGAERVYAWSFYSQGTGERVTSADIFVDDALRWFGDTEMADNNRSSWDKGQRLAELVQKQRTLLLLDGLEPLQSWWEHDRGRINDPALAVLVKQLARKNPGLCVITSRETVTGLEAYSKWFTQKNLEQISGEAGRALLRVAGIRGTDAELEQAVRDFGNHALAINLLAAYLQDVPGHEISAASLIPDLDTPPKKGKHPRRVMEGFANRFREKPELNVLYLMGLFDRPADAGDIACVRKKPPISGLTDRVSGLSDGDWNRIVENLRHSRLIALESHHNPGGLDAHPLVREHFAEKLTAEYPAAWKEGHSRLYEYYKGLPEKDFPDTLEEMMPLYQAVAHGCLGGRHQEAMDGVYWPRTLRARQFYSKKKLGAFGADLAALAGFFDLPWSRPMDALNKSDRAFVLNGAGFDLRALGHLAEAVEPMKAALHLFTVRKEWKSAAIEARNLSELSLAVGDVANALEYAGRSVKYPDTGRDAFQPWCERAALGNALHKAGRLAEAETAFREAEEMQKEGQPEYPLLYSLRGFQYCDLLLSRGEHHKARCRAAQTLEWAKNERILLDMALDLLTLGRASFLAALEAGTPDFGEAAAQLDRAVDGLRRAGYQDDLPRGLLARAEHHRVSGDLGRARRDLDEAYEIATTSRMRLYECDCDLESCRLILAMEEAGEKLDADELFPDSPLALYDAVNDPRAAAREHLNKAETMVNEMGYHRRDPEILLETAHIQILEAKKEAARQTLDKAKKKIDKMGAHRWDVDLRDLNKRL